MLRDSDFCRNLSATSVGTWGDITEGECADRKQESGPKENPSCLLANLTSDGLRLRPSPCTPPVNSECVCWDRRLWFHWLRTGSNFRLKEEKKSDKEHLQGPWDTDKQEGTVSASCTLMGVYSYNESPFGGLCMYPRHAKNDSFCCRKSTYKFELIFIFE